MKSINKVIIRIIYKFYYEKYFYLKETNNMKSAKILKYVGYAATALSMIAGLVSEYVDGKQMEAKIDEAVDKKLKERSQEEEEES